MKPHSNVQTIISAIILLALLFSTQTARSESQPVEYSFGIGPSQTATELGKRWIPIINYIAEKSGVPLHFRTAKDIPTFQQQMAEGLYDMAYINPYHYLVYHKSSNRYTAFAQEKDGKLVGVLVVKKDGPIQNLSQLNGQTLAFPAPNALAATWLPMSMLREKNITVTPQYVTSMDSVYRSIAKGLYVAGGGETRTLSTIDPEVKSQLQVIWSSGNLPPFAFAAHARVPKKVVDKIQKAMSQMENDPKGKELLKAINFTGIEPASDADYNEIRRMNIKPVVESRQ